MRQRELMHLFAWAQCNQNDSRVYQLGVENTDEKMETREIEGKKCTQTVFSV